MMDTIWCGMMLFSVLSAFFHGTLTELSAAVLSGAAESVKLVISLTGALCFWSGIAEINERSGFADRINTVLKPILKKIFPMIDPASAAFRNISMNVTANLLGLGNAATPLGLKAMEELQKYSPLQKGQASVDMIKFVVMNTASMQLIPTTAATIRADAGSSTPFDILLPVWISSLAAMLTALSAVKLCTLRTEKPHKTKQKRPLSLFGMLPLSVLLPFLKAELPEKIGNAALPICLFVIFAFALIKKVKVFDCFIKGGKSGLQTAIGLLPSLCALVTAVTMLQESGAMHMIVTVLSPVGKLLGIPAELLPLCLIRPLSGSGALSVYKNILTTMGADSTLGRTAAVLSGASETTFYAITVYYGSIGISRTGCTLPCALLADLVCYITACKIVI